MFEKSHNLYIMRNLALLLLVFLAVATNTRAQFDNLFKTRTDTTVFDYSSLDWVSAFDSLHACMSLRYPYTEWKAVKWPEKLAKIRPQIQEAMNTGDTADFIKNLYTYLYEIPDGHINLVGNINSFKKEYMQGSYGFNMIPADNGEIIATLVPQSGAAYAAGLRTGDKILMWNGIHIDSVPNTEYNNYNRNYGTLEGRILSRYLMLTRDKIGKNASVTFLSSLSGKEETISLHAEDDQSMLYIMGFLNTVPMSILDSMVIYKILPNEVGYLRITSEDSDGMTLQEVMESDIFILAAQAIEYFNVNDINKLVVDLRFNLGGNDLLATALLGFFYNTSEFYEHITGTYDDNYEIIFSLYVEPLTPQYTGEIVVLTDPNCISSGEGMAMMFQKLSNAHVISSWGTNGAYGIVDFGPVYMPGGLIITFPQAISLDQDLKILLESDSTMHGGVSLDVRIPLTVENIRRQWENGEDVQLESALSFLLEIEEEKWHHEIFVFPNPCKDQLHLKLPEAPSDYYQVVVYNIVGKRIMQEQIFHDGGNVPYVMNIQSLVPGIYICCIETGDFMYNYKIIVG